MLKNYPADIISFIIKKEEMTPNKAKKPNKKTFK